MPKFAIVIMTLIGLLFGTVGAVITFNAYTIILTGDDTQGQIIEYKIGSSDGTTMYTPIVEFKCGGIYYTEGSSVSSSTKSYKVGEIVDLYCIEDNFIFKKGFDKYFGLIFLLAGLGILSIPIINKILKIKKEKLKQELLYNGDYIRSTVTFVGYDMSYSVNRRNPMYFTCEYIDNDNKQVHQFKSGYFWNGLLSEHVKIGEERRVYVRIINMKRYYIDIDDIKTSK